jgi:hypothetical protein
MRPVKPRDDYARDIATLHRIASALKLDERISVEVREGVIGDLHRAIRRLMGVELASLEESDPPEVAPEVAPEREGVSAPEVSVPEVSAPDASESETFEFDGGRGEGSGGEEAS